MSGKRLVVDACVGSSSGYKEQYPESKYSREALLAIKNNHDHILVFTSELSTEWQNRASRFGTKFRAEMARKGRTSYVPDDAWRTLMGRCTRVLSTAAEIASFEKDFHLVAAALYTDRVIVSNEKNLPNHLISVRHDVSEVRDLQFGNPRIEEQICVDWLAAGAPVEIHRAVSSLTPL